jgi:hypothetical protein
MRATGLFYFAIAIVSGVLTLELCIPARLAAQTSAGPTPLDSRGDLGRLVDIGGGRRIYLECYGTGGPTGGRLSLRRFFERRVSRITRAWDHQTTLQR